MIKFMQKVSPVQPFLVKKLLENRLLRNLLVFVNFLVNW
jgi:hypothetical protein